MTVPVSLYVEGQRLEGFVRGSIFTTMLDAYGTFSLEYVPTGAPTPIVDANQLVSVDVGDTTVIAGYTDDVQHTDMPDELRYTLVGRSLTQDLVDSTVPRVAWTNRKLIDVVTDLTAPFSIPVATTVLPSADLAPIPAFRTVKGESVYDAILRACNQQKFFAYALGSRLAVRDVAVSDYISTKLTRGVNVASTVRSRSVANRYSHYLLSTQTKSTDDNNGRSASQLQSSVTDDEIAAKRFRPLVVTVDTGEKRSLKQKAEWERDRRIASSDSLRVTVVGFETGDSAHPVWEPNVLVTYSANPAVGIHTDTTFLVTEVRFEFGADAPQLAELTLVRPDSLVQ